MQGHLYCDDTQAAQGRRSARLDTGDQSRELWFEAKGISLSIDTGADPFLLATLMFWMQEGKDVHVHGSVSRTLLAGLTEWQMAWVRWRPERYRQIEITVDEVRDDLPAGRKAILAFSGGVDAAYSLRSHLTGAAGWQQVTLSAAILVHGFDIPLEQPDAFHSAAVRAQRMLDGTEVTLVTLATNLRELGTRWEDAFASAVASCLTLFAPECGVGLIGSSDPYDLVILPYGSNPATDHLLSSGLMEIRHDGAGASRTDKVRLLAEWPGANHLRVCWQGEALDRNCGHCEKCARTRLNFALAGVANPVCLEGSEVPSSPILLRSDEQLTEWFSLASEARSSGNMSVLREAEAVLRRYRVHKVWQRSRIPGAFRRARRLLIRARLGGKRA